VILSPLVLLSRVARSFAVAAWFSSPTSYSAYFPDVDETAIGLWKPDSGTTLVVVRASKGEQPLSDDDHGSDITERRWNLNHCLNRDRMLQIRNVKRLTTVSRL
jgi:hypothetical protein